MSSLNYSDKLKVRNGEIGLRQIKVERGGEGNSSGFTNEASSQNQILAPTKSKASCSLLVSTFLVIE
jgi:hypothetical protein